jgi:site-specific DNA-methyltransferase (adenine-specific)
MREEVIGDCRLILGDCADVLPMLEPVCAVVTDPPYGIDITKSNRIATSRGMGGVSWDEEPLSGELLRLVLAAADQHILWGGNYFDLPPARCFLVWDKVNEGRDFADCEMAWTSIDAVARIFRLRPMNMDGGKVHPTQKPVELMRWCLDKVTGRTVLDPFMGSGSTGVAAAKMGRRFIGIEKHEPYFDIACRRVEEAYKQPDFLVERPAPPKQEALL